MAIIVIKDLPENVELDRQAMVAITGGARVSVRQTYLGRAISSSTRILNYPPSFARNSRADANGQSARSTPRK